MSALERNPQVPAQTPHMVLCPVIDGRGNGDTPEQLAWGLAFPEATRCLCPFQAKLFSPNCIDIQAEDRLTPRWHVGQPCGKASWESLVGKPRGKATDPLIHAKGSVTLLLQLGRKAHVHAPTREED